MAKNTNYCALIPICACKNIVRYHFLIYLCAYGATCICVAQIKFNKDWLNIPSIKVEKWKLRLVANYII